MSIRSPFGRAQQKKPAAGVNSSDGLLWLPDNRRCGYPQRDYQLSKSGRNFKIKNWATMRAFPFAPRPLQVPPPAQSARLVAAHRLRPEVPQRALAAAAELAPQRLAQPAIAAKNRLGVVQLVGRHHQSHRGGSAVQAADERFFPRPPRGLGRLDRVGAAIDDLDNPRAESAPISSPWPGRPGPRRRRAEARRWPRPHPRHVP